jgi:hypothetical protein
MNVMYGITMNAAMAPRKRISWDASKLMEPNKNAENGTMMNATNGTQVYIQK